MIRRYISAVDPGGASGIPCYILEVTPVSGDAFYDEYTYYIVGAADAVVAMKLTTYFNNNTAEPSDTTGIFENGNKVILNDQFMITLDGSGNGNFTAIIQGNPANTGTTISGTFSIVSVSVGQVGSPSSSLISKNF